VVGRLGPGKLELEALGADVAARAETPPFGALESAGPDAAPPSVLGDPQALLATIARDTSERSRRIMAATVQGNLTESTTD
jgi:hypothetical protein